MRLPVWTLGFGRLGWVQKSFIVEVRGQSADEQPAGNEDAAAGELAPPTRNER